jgi:hypothetical protein
VFFESSVDRSFNGILRASFGSKHYRKYDYTARAHACPRAYIGTA